VVPASAGLKRQAAGRLVVDRTEDAERLGVLPLIDDRGRGEIGRRAEVEAFDVEILVEVEDARLIAEALRVVRRDPEFLRELVKARDIVLALRRERNVIEYLNMIKTGTDACGQPLKRQNTYDVSLPAVHAGLQKESSTRTTPCVLPIRSHLLNLHLQSIRSAGVQSEDRRNQH
jgi:hypothetical protein